jgi:dTDP-4-amino-4,6-dideoxygalactose transaminase
MIRRARPKYLEISDMDKNTIIRFENPNELFFNYGRSALKFFLWLYANYLHKKLYVAMQSFNCEVVIEAALQANCRVILLDIKLNDYSINFEDLLKIPKPDVLILTHYQGIPNLQYEQISSFCKQNKILLIDDLAQTEGSLINNIVVGSLSDISIKSFSFDRPFTCYAGGSLYIGNITDIHLKELILQQYSLLKFENKKKTLVDLMLLKFLFKNSTEKQYIERYDTYDLIMVLKKMNMKDATIIKLLKHNVSFNFIAKTIYYYRLFITPNKRKIIVRKLGIEKINLINFQRSRYLYNAAEVIALEKYLSCEGYKIQRYPNIYIVWNRYSIIDDSNTLKEKLNSYMIQSGNYNWSTPLNKKYYKNKNVILTDNYSNTEYCAQNILNIPVWSTIFCNNVENKKQYVY